MTEFISLDASIDLSKWDSSIAQMIADANKIEDRLKFGDVKIKVAIDSSDIEATQRLVSDMDSATATVKVNTDDAELDTSIKKVGDLDTETATVKIDASDNTASAIKGVEEKLANLQTLATIELLLNVEGFTGKFTSLPFVSQIMEAEAAAATLNARVVESIPNADELINNIYVNGWGASKDEIAQVLAAASGLGVMNEDLEAAATAALQFANVWGEDPIEVMAAMNSIVANDLAPNFQGAFDVLQSGMENGLNRGQDLLDTFREYGSTFKNVGLDGEGALELLNSGLQSGIDNTDRIADATREFNLRVSNMEPPTVAALDVLGLSEQMDLFQAGELSGADFMDGVIQAIQDYKPTGDMPTGAMLAADIFGSQSEDFGKAFFGIDADADLLAPIKGAGIDAANEIGGTLSAAFTEASRTLETELVTALDNALDISGFLDGVKNAAVTFADTIQGGGTIGEGIEVALSLEEGSVSRIESAIANFLIGLLDAVATIGSMAGFDVSGVEKEVARLSQGQLVFDLQNVQNEEDLSNAVGLAFDRGVEKSNVEAAISTAVDEMLAKGDVAGAQALIDGAAEGFARTISMSGGPMGTTLTAEAQTMLDTSQSQAQVDTFVADLHTQLTAAINAKDWEGALDLANKLGLDNAEQLVSDLHLSSQLSAIEIPAQVSFDPTTFDQNMQGMTEDILVELNGAESAITEKSVTVAAVSTRIVDDVESAEETVTTSIPTFTEAEHTITNTGVEVENVSMRIVDAGILAADGTATASADMNVAYGAIAVGSAFLLVAMGNYNALASAVQSSAPGMTSQLSQISDALSGFANAGGKALEVSGGLQTVGTPSGAQTGSTGAPIGHAEGGFKPEGMGGWVGEQGPEYQVAGQDVSILNNQTSEALWTAMQSMGMRGGGGSTTHNTYNINVINNNASGAQHYGAMQGFANKIRGQ